MRVIADALDRFDDARGVDLIISPIDGKAALGEIEPRIDDPGQFDQPILDLADASGTGDALHCQRHVRCAGISRLDEQRKVEGLGHCRHSVQYDAILGTKQPLALA
jgi:hypothetical protein